MGRPNLYFEKVEPRLAELRLWAKAGATNAEIAQALDVGYSNFCSYISKYPELKDALRESRLSGVPEIKLALYRRALGFEYEEKKISIRREDGEDRQYIETVKKQALPDVGAIQTFLRNYDPNFRDKDSLTNDFRKLELELKKQIAEQNNF